MVNERLDSELSATARQIIADARGADDPTAEDEARVKARWLAGIAAGAGVSSLTEAVRAAAGSGWGLKVAAMVAAAAVASVGVYVAWPESKRDTPAPTVVAVQAPPAAPVAPPAEPSVAPVTVPVQEVPSAGEVAAIPAAPEPATPADTPALVAPDLAPVAAAPAAPAAKVPAVPPRAAPSAVRARTVAAERAQVLPVEGEPAAAPAQVGGQLGEEIALLSQIRGTLQDGAATRALEQLREYRQRFERPSLAMEADALQVDALCRAGQREAAQAAATAFMSNWPDSPLQQRVSSACP
jgi:hypothetical protein